MLLQDPVLHASLWTLYGSRLVCHCKANEACHGDLLVEEFRKLHPHAYDRSNFYATPPASSVLSFMLRLPEEPESDEGVPD